ncbi:hypothetical protein Taro_043475 [Colocasia esculenta]|uniref:Uncharacterized protein n=1 Tax=Colocasia esculenta TaxID=4460 RepID=A0A843X462_COLES|nr:hypothetical protein [Colocasia esculenta]
MGDSISCEALPDRCLDSEPSTSIYPSSSEPNAIVSFHSTREAGSVFLHVLPATGNDADTPFDLILHVANPLSLLFFVLFLSGVINEETPSTAAGHVCRGREDPHHPPRNLPAKKPSIHAS